MQLVYDCDQTCNLELYRITFYYWDAAASEGQGAYSYRSATDFYVKNDTLTITDVGQGAYYFQVYRSGGHGGYKLKYKASIIFDYNEVIETNEYANTLDLVSPVTQMKEAA